jgi:hypothetical protein
MHPQTDDALFCQNRIPPARIRFLPFCPSLLSPARSLHAPAFPGNPSIHGASPGISAVNFYGEIAPPQGALPSMALLLQVPPQSTPLPPRSRLPRVPFHPWCLPRDLHGQFLRRNRASPGCPSIHGVVAASAPTIPFHRRHSPSIDKTALPPFHRRHSP